MVDGEVVGSAARETVVPLEVHDEWQVTERRYRSEASMAKLYETGKHGHDRKEVGTKNNELLAG